MANTKKNKKNLAKRRDYLLKETIVMISADLFQDIYDSKGCNGFTDACDKIIHLAEEFEKKLNWTENVGKLDYIDELEKFENNVRKRLHIANN